MQIEKGDYVDFNYVVSYFKENFHSNSELKLIRIISSYDEFFGRETGYKINFALIEKDELDKLNKSILTKNKKDIVTINLLPLGEEIKNPEDQKVSYYPTTKMENQKEDILSKCKIIFDETLTDEKMDYSSMDEIPFIKKNCILQKIVIFNVNEFKDEIKRTINGVNSKEDKEIKKLCYELYNTIKQRLIHEIENRKEMLQSIREKINSSAFYNDEERKLIKESLELYEQIINSNPTDILSSLKLTKKNKRT